MARTPVVRLRVEHLLTDYALWCRICALSTGVRVWLATEVQGVTRLQSKAKCSECGGDQIEQAD